MNEPILIVAGAGYAAGQWLPNDRSRDGEEGVRLANERQSALILMDIQLPGINGIEALQEKNDLAWTASVSPDVDRKDLGPSAVLMGMRRMIL